MRLLPCHKLCIHLPCSTYQEDNFPSNLKTAKRKKNNKQCQPIKVQKTMFMEETLWCKNVKMITHWQYFHMVLFL